MSDNAQTSSAEELLRETADYLRRLPKVPTTTALIRKIDAHLSEGDKLQRGKTWAGAREGVVTTPIGLVLFSVRVEGDSVSVHAPVSSNPGSVQLCEFGPDVFGEHEEGEYRSGAVDFGKALDEARMKILNKGINLDLRPADFPSQHAILMEQSQEYARASKLK